MEDGSSDSNSEDDAYAGLDDFLEDIVEDLEPWEPRFWKFKKKNESYDILDAPIEELVEKSGFPKRPDLFTHSFIFEEVASYLDFADTAKLRLTGSRPRNRYFCWSDNKFWNIPSLLRRFSRKIRKALNEHEFQSSWTNGIGGHFLF